MDSDGLIDAFVGTRSGFPGEQGFGWFGDGKGYFSSGTYVVPGLATTSVALGDVDGDGDVDVVESSSESLVGRLKGIQVRLGAGNRLLTEGQAIPLTLIPSSLALGDLDGDGDLDLVIGLRNGGNQVWLNEPIAGFVDSAQSLVGGSQTNDLALADVDGDGDLDLVTGNLQANRIWLNDSAGVFTDSGQAIGSSQTADVELADLDGDGDLDLVCGNGFFNQVGTEPSTWGGLNLAPDTGAPELTTVWFNDGSGSFSATPYALGPYRTSAIELADVDGDGSVDILVGNVDPGSSTILVPDLNHVFLNDLSR